MFDFDGVIADTLECSYASSQVAQGKPITIERYRAMFYGNIFESSDVSEQRVREGVSKPAVTDVFFKHYIPLMLERPPIEAMLTVLEGASKRHPVVMISSTVNQPLRDYLARYDIAHHFSMIMGGDTHTSKVVKIQMAKELYQVNDQDCLFVTDTLGDVLEAKKAGVQSIAVTWGFHLPHELAQGNPLTIVDTPAALQTAINAFYDFRE